MEGENCANAWGVHMQSYNSVPTATESLKILIHVTDNRSWKFFFGCYLLHTERVPIHVQVTEGDFQYTKSSIVYIHWWLIHSCELSWRKEWSTTWLPYSIINPIMPALCWHTKTTYYAQSNASILCLSLGRSTMMKQFSKHTCSW